jgi:hypothetical protein
VPEDPERRERIFRRLSLASSTITILLGVGLLLFAASGIGLSPALNLVFGVVLIAYGFWRMSWALRRGRD